MKSVEADHYFEYTTVHDRASWKTMLAMW